MQINVICSLNGIENTDINFTFSDFQLVKGTSSLNGHLMDKYFIEQVGNIGCSRFINKPYFAAIFNEENDDNYDLLSISEGVYAELNHFVSNLWFSKDCCPSVGAIYFYIPSKKRIFIRQNHSRPSSGTGAYPAYIVDGEDLKLAEKIASKFDRKVTLKNPTQNKPTIGLLNQSVPPTLFQLDYNTTLRLERCMLFLGLARHQAHLPVKIALYMSIFECLFTSDSSEVGHKIAERAAVYVSKNKEEMYSIFKTAKVGYDYRSKFLHGQNLRKKRDDYQTLSEIASSIDELLRKILNKAVLEDFDLLNSFDGNELDDYFNEKLFQKQ